MAADGRDHNDLGRIVDDFDKLFRHLIHLREMLPTKAQNEIRHAFCDGKLWVEIYAEEGWKPVHRESWELDGAFRLRAEGIEHLLIEPRRSLNFAWDSDCGRRFRIANLDRIDELWPAPPQPEPVAPTPSTMAYPSGTDAMGMTGSGTDASAAGAGNADGAEPHKLPRKDWLTKHISAAKAKGLIRKHGGRRKAAEAVNKMMEVDPAVDAYENPKSIEPHLRDILREAVNTSFRSGIKKT